jgi:hypothetical protein
MRATKSRPPGALPLACLPTPCEDARPMLQPRADAQILTSARMAAGMTSRARRRLPPHQAG